ncbi:MAG: HD domain-containing protein, partial [Actinomycetota bacterium]|nr:HD domain-containing protein [Actinomycetota bacterium]
MREQEERKGDQGVSLSPAAWAREASVGRLWPEPPDGVRNPFQRDRDRIIHAKAFRRLMHKTQVFISPDGDHFRTRLTHTLEMMQISRTIARSLGLNEDLTEAIALGHDLGHTPFGHTGEEALTRVLAPHGR